MTEGHLTKKLGAGAKRALEGKVWKDLHGRKIKYRFTKDTLPYKRAVAFHAKCAYRQAAQRGYVPASFDATLVDHDHWSVKGARQKVSFEFAHPPQRIEKCCTPDLVYIFSYLLQFLDGDLHAT